MPWPLRTAPDVVLQVHGPAQPTAPVAVVLHGVGSTADFALRCLTGPLTELGYAVVAPDLRGHAGSTALPDPADHSLEHHVADLTVLAAQVDVRLVAGISLGAEVALRWACTRPGPALDGLLLCLPGVVGPTSAPAEANRVVAGRLASAGLAALLAELAVAEAALPWVVDEVQASWPRHDVVSLRAALLAVAGATPVSPTGLSTLATPVGIVAVTDDLGHPAEAARALAAALPYAAVDELALADLAEDRSDLGRAAVRAWTRARGLRRGSEPD